MSRVSTDLPTALVDTSVALPALSELHEFHDPAFRTLEALAAAAVSGGATYDGLIGATAAEARLPLITLDRRALRTYEAVGAEVHYLG